MKLEIPGCGHVVSGECTAKRAIVKDPTRCPNRCIQKDERQGVGGGHYIIMYSVSAVSTFDSFVPWSRLHGTLGPGGRGNGKCCCRLKAKKEAKLDVHEMR